MFGSWLTRRHASGILANLYAVLSRSVPHPILNGKLSQKPVINLLNLVLLERRLRLIQRIEKLEHPIQPRHSETIANLPFRRGHVQLRLHLHGLV